MRVKEIGVFEQILIRHMYMAKDIVVPSGSIVSCYLLASFFQMEELKDQILNSVNKDNVVDLIEECIDRSCKNTNEQFSEQFLIGETCDQGFISDLIQLCIKWLPSMSSSQFKSIQSPYAIIQLIHFTEDVEQYRESIKYIVEEWVMSNKKLLYEDSDSFDIIFDCLQPITSTNCLVLLDIGNHLNNKRVLDLSLEYIVDHFYSMNVGDIIHILTIEQLISILDNELLVSESEDQVFQVVKTILTKSTLEEREKKQLLNSVRVQSLSGSCFVELSQLCHNISDLRRVIERRELSHGGTNMNRKEFRNPAESKEVTISNLDVENATHLLEFSSNESIALPDYTSVKIHFETAIIKPTHLMVRLSDQASSKVSFQVHGVNLRGLEPSLLYLTTSIKSNTVYKIDCHEYLKAIKICALGRNLSISSIHLYGSVSQRPKANTKQNTNLFLYF